MMTPTNAMNTIIKNSLNEDFCEALSEQIILQNIMKCRLSLDNLDREGYIKLIDSIAFDYRAILPSANGNITLKKRKWLSAIE